MPKAHKRQASLTVLCQDHDEDCPSIFAEGGCLACWLYDPARGFCPYLRPIEDLEDEKPQSAKLAPQE